MRGRPRGCWQKMAIDWSSMGEGCRASHEYVITPEIYERFLATFEDTNPMHTDAAFARARGFADKVMHGAILQGFVSHFVGVRFPGAGSVLQVVNVQYKSPCHLGDRVRIDGVVTQVVEAVRVVRLDLTLKNLTRDRVAAKAKVQVGLP